MLNACSISILGHLLLAASSDEGEQSVVPRTCYLVPVTFHMDISGCLRISVGTEESPADASGLYWLVLYSALLFGAYIFFKIYFRQDRWITEQGEVGVF